jgi:tetratricopeptide (TPR) repeat protein
MSDEDLGSADGAVSTDDLVDQVCDRFEAGWRAGSRPRIEASLSDADPPLRDRLLRELLMIELCWRKRGRESPEPAEYLDRFPHREDIPAIVAAFVWNGSAPSRFTNLEFHERGGLGVVFKAHDSELKRVVALKKIRDDRAHDPGSQARFLREGESTGRLEHPGIVPVYSLNRGDDGKPFYAMRFIRGETLSDAVARFHGAEDAGRGRDERALALRGLLRRLIDVCNVVAYAHSQGVLHRDIKPDNIMLGPFGETLLLDWGLAKPLGSALDPAGLEQAQAPDRPSSASDTRPGSLVGTPRYMSPEQATRRHDRMGPASDVYSLGATLYTVLTGQQPFAPENDIEVILNRVQASDFPPPRALARDIPRPLEAIALKAMAKVPDERYASAGRLAEDLEHWLADEPVAAWPEPYQVRAGRWMRRHRTAVMGAVATLVVGLAGLGAASAVQAQANRQLRGANIAIKDALDKTRRAQDETKRALAQSEESRQQAEAVARFLVEALRSPDPSQDGRLVRVADVLEQAAEKLDIDFTGSPATKGAFLHAVGRTYVGLGLYDKAELLLSRARTIREAALGPNHPETLASRSELALAYEKAGRSVDAIALCETTLKLQESTLGPRHPDTLQSRNHLALAYHGAGRTNDAIAMDQETLKLRESILGLDHLDTLESRNNLASAYQDAGRNTEAIALHQATLKICEAKLGLDHPGTLASCNNLARGYFWAGRTTDAIALFESTLKLAESKLGPEHPNTLTSRSNLASAYREAGRIVDAIAMDEATLKLSESKLGRDHPGTLTSRNNLATGYETAGRTADAIALYETTLNLQESTLGPEHPNTLASRNNLAGAYQRAGRILEAIAMGEVTFKLCEAKLGPDHPETLHSANNLGSAYNDSGRTSLAIALLQTTLKRLEAKLGYEHQSTIVSRGNLALAYLASGRTALAITLLELNLKRQEATLGPDHPEALRSRNNLAAAYEKAGRTAEAIPLFEATLRLSEAKLGPNHPGTLYTSNNLALAYGQTGRAALAIPLFERTLELLESKVGSNHPNTRATRDNLVQAYASAGAYSRSEPLLREGMEWARKMFGATDVRTAAAIAQLGLNLVQQRKWIEAEPILRECLTIREKRQPHEWSTFNTRSQLGGSLLGQGRFAEAEPLILSGYEGMKAGENKIPAPGKPRLPEAADRVVRLYEAWGKEEAATQWRARLGRHASDLPLDVFAR